MKLLRELLTEEWTKEDERRMKEWTSRTFNAIGPPKGPWYVENRLALRDNKVAGPYDDKQEAWAEADRLQDIDRQKQIDYYRSGGSDMTLAPINRDAASWRRSRENS